MSDLCDEPESDTEAALISYTAPFFSQPERAVALRARAGKKTGAVYEIRADSVSDSVSASLSGLTRSADV